MVSRFYYA